MELFRIFDGRPDFGQGGPGRDTVQPLHGRRTARFRPNWPRKNRAFSPTNASGPKPRLLSAPFRPGPMLYGPGPARHGKTSTLICARTAAYLSISSGVDSPFICGFVAEDSEVALTRFELPVRGGDAEVHVENLHLFKLAASRMSRSMWQNTSTDMYVVRCVELNRDPPASSIRSSQGVVLDVLQQPGRCPWLVSRVHEVRSRFQVTMTRSGHDILPTSCPISFIGKTRNGLEPPYSYRVRPYGCLTCIWYSHGITTPPCLKSGCEDTL